MKPPVQAEESPSDSSAGVLCLAIQYLVGGESCDGGQIGSIGIRAIAGAWVLAPKFSGSKTARMFGVPRTTFMSHAAEFSRAVGIKNRFQTRFDGAINRKMARGKAAT